MRTFEIRRFAAVSILAWLVAGLAASSSQAPDIAIAPFTVEGDSASVLRIAADTSFERFARALTAKGITVARHARLTDRTLGTAKPAPWAVLGHIKRSKDEVSAEFRLLAVATGEEMRSYHNSGKDAQPTISIDRIAPRIIAFIQESKAGKQ